MFKRSSLEVKMCIKGREKDRCSHKPVRTSLGGVRQRKVICAFNTSSVPEGRK